MVDYPIRKETGRYWSVARNEGEATEGSEKFMRGMEALRAIRRAFYNDADWERMGLPPSPEPQLEPQKYDKWMKEVRKRKYAFQDSIEDMLKNPGSSRDNPKYKTLKTALSTLAVESKEKVDALEEAALMVLGVLRRRRGSETQMARMGEERLGQRREARNILTQWDEGTRSPPTPRPTIPRPPPVTPLPEPPGERRGGGDDWFVLSVNVSPENSGRTTPRDGEIHKYKPGSVVTVQQKENRGFVFQHWEVDGVAVGGANLRITMNANHTVFAVYEGGEEEGKVYLTVESDPFEGVEVGLDGLRMGVTTAYKQVDKNSMHTIKVPAEARDPNGNIYKFAAWENGSKPMPVRGVITRVVHVSEPMTVIARYEALILIVDSSPERGIPVKFGHRPVTRPTDVTRIKEVVEKGKTYMVSVPPTYTAPDGTFYTFKKWEDESQQTERQVLMGDEPKTITAFYAAGGKVTHKRYGGVLSPYQGGVSPRGVGGAKDLARSALAMSGVRGRISREVKAREFGAKGKEGKIIGKQDPFILSIINKGKRILDSYAAAEYTKIFDPMKKRYKARSKLLKSTKADASKARKELRRLIRKYRRQSDKYIRQHFMQTNQDTLNLAQNVRGATGVNPADQIAIDANSKILDDYLKAQDKYYEDFERELEANSAHLRDYLISRAKTVAIGLARRAKMPLNGEDEAAILEALEGYAGSIAEDFVTRGRTMAHGFMRGLGGMSRSLETGGAAITNIFVNLFTFITGPWTLTSLFALLEFFFILTYVGYNIQLLWMFPIIAAIFTLILNFSDSFQPLDWVTHLSSGAIIGYSAALLLVALGAPSWGFIGGPNTIGFWIAWFILGFIGLFQFYQTGGYKVVLQVGVLVLLLSYLAMGPYQAYFHAAVDQVRTPVEIAYRSVSSAVTDVWLLATNPTEWYARQQLVNVRAERPLDLPKGVEITSLETLPPSVPAGQQFAMAAVIRNDGMLRASDIILSVGCNQWCNSHAAAPTSTKPYEDAKSRLDQTTINALNSSSAFYIDDKMERKEGQAITFQPLVAIVFTKSVAQTNIAKVTFNLSYAYSTNSSLQVDVINENELERRFREGDTVFKPVVAIDKGTPARLSLNVGPQPLRAGTNETILLVSISNTRENSKVVLPRGTDIIIKLPKAIGHDLYCGASQQVLINDENYMVVNYKIEPSSPSQDSIEILPFEFNSIFAFICKFTTNEVDTMKSGFVTAELPRYIFRIEQKKDVVITPALGIIFEPFEQECSKCGHDPTYSQGIDMPGVIADLDRCTASLCHQITRDLGDATDSSETCYFEYAAKTLTQVVGTPCKVCGSVPSGATDNCGKFLNKETCDKEKVECGWNCFWNPTGLDPVTKTKIGACEKGEVPVIGTCTDVPSAFISAYNTQYKDIIANAIRSSGLRNYVQYPEALVAAVISQESSWNPRASNPADPSYGLMGISAATAKQYGCDTGKIAAFDATENIKCGAKILAGIAKEHINDPPKTYACNSVQYSGIDAVIRYYNGWPSDCSGDRYYVDNVKKHYSNWLACFSGSTTSSTTTTSTTSTGSTTETCVSCTSAGKVWCKEVYSSYAICEASKTDCFNKMQHIYDPFTNPSECPATSTTTTPTAVAKGDANYCKNLYDTAGASCDIGWGGCIAGTCDSSKSYDLDADGTYERLTCTGISGKSICCTPPSDWSDTAGQQCMNLYNAWLGK